MSSSRHPGGRPSSLTHELKQRLIQAILAGSHLEAACHFAGIDYSTFAEWMRRGEGRDRRRQRTREFAQFAQEIRAALAQAEIGLTRRIMESSRDDWRAAAWILERRHPTRWANAQRIQIEVDKELDKALDKLENALPPELFDRVLSALTDGTAGEAEAGPAPDEF